jgi:hypothetical protein
MRPALCTRTRMAGAVTALSICSAAAPARADVVISNAATQNMACTNGVCAPTAAKAVLNVGDLENLLAAGNVEVTTTGSGVQAKDIEVGTVLTWSGGTTLSFDAYQSIAIGKGVSVGGSGGLSLTTDDGGNNGSLSFGPKGNVQFASLDNVLTINGTPFSLVGSIASLAGAIAANPSGAYALAGDYDASGDGNYHGSPVPTSFSGTFEGLGNTISQLSIAPRGNGFVGLFAELAVSGVVDGLRLNHEHIVVRRSNLFAAGLVGENYGTISRDTVEGVFLGKKADCGLAGLVGNNEGTISLSSAAVRIVSCGEDGGLVIGSSTLIEASSTSGSISITNAGVAGGIASGIEGMISDSYSTVVVSVGDAGSGGGTPWLRG